MRIRTFILILVVLAFFWGLTVLFVKNAEVLQQPFDLGDGTELPIGITLVIVFVIGALTTLVFGLSREMGRLTDRWRHFRARRKSDEIEEEYSRGLVAVLEGREEQALSHFRAVLELDSRHFNTLLKLGEVLRTLGKHNDAIEFHRKAQHLKEDDTRPLYSLCEDYEAKGDMTRARAVLGKILAINKNSVSAWRKLRYLHMKEENWDDALEAHQKAEKYSSAHDPRDEADRRVGKGIRYEIAKGRLHGRSAEGRHGNPAPAVEGRAALHRGPRPGG